MRRWTHPRDRAKFRGGVERHQGNELPLRDRRNPGDMHIVAEVDPGSSITILSTIRAEMSPDYPERMTAG